MLFSSHHKINWVQNFIGQVTKVGDKSMLLLYNVKLIPFLSDGTELLELASI